MGRGRAGRGRGGTKEAGRCSTASRVQTVTIQMNGRALRFWPSDSKGHERRGRGGRAKRGKKRREERRGGEKREEENGGGEEEGKGEGRREEAHPGMMLSTPAQRPAPMDQGLLVASRLAKGKGTLEIRFPGSWRAQAGAFKKSRVPRAAGAQHVSEQGLNS